MGSQIIHLAPSFQPRILVLKVLFIPSDGPRLLASFHSTSLDKWQYFSRPPFINRVAAFQALYARGIFRALFCPWPRLRLLSCVGSQHPAPPPASRTPVQSWNSNGQVLEQLPWHQLLLSLWFGFFSSSPGPGASLSPTANVCCAF